MSFVVTPDNDFWEDNPNLKKIKPYSTLYKDNSDSSVIMKAIFFIEHPDPDVNPFSEMDEQYILNNLDDEFKDINWEDELVQECKERFPFDCLSAAERAYKEEKEKLIERAKFIKNTELTLDHTIIETDEKSGKRYGINVKGTASQIESMRKNTTKIYEQYQKIEDLFLKEKSQIRAKGGRTISRAEKGEI